MEFSKTGQKESDFSENGKKFEDFGTVTGCSSLKFLKIFKKNSPKKSKKTLKL